MTGVTDLNVEVASKRLELLRELVPRANSFALLVNQASPTRAAAVVRDTETAARTLGLQLHVLNASNDGELDAVFANIQPLGTGGLVIGADAFFAGRSNNSVCWQLATECRRSLYTETLLWPAASRAMVPTRPTCSERSAFIVADSQGRKARRSAGSSINES